MNGLPYPSLSEARRNAAKPRGMTVSERPSYGSRPLLGLIRGNRLRLGGSLFTGSLSRWAFSRWAFSRWAFSR